MNCKPICRFFKVIYKYNSTGTCGFNNGSNDFAQILSVYSTSKIQHCSVLTCPGSSLKWKYMYVCIYRAVFTYGSTWAMARGGKFWGTANFLGIFFSIPVLQFWKFQKYVYVHAYRVDLHCIFRFVN